MFKDANSVVGIKQYSGARLKVWNTRHNKLNAVSSTHLHINTIYYFSWLHKNIKWCLILNFHIHVNLVFNTVLWYHVLQGNAAHSKARAAFRLRLSWNLHNMFHHNKKVITLMQAIKEHHKEGYHFIGVVSVNRWLYIWGQRVHISVAWGRRS